MQDTYKHSDMGHLEEKLQEHQDKRFRLIITDGVFSMDGDLAKLDEIVALAEKYDAMVFVDDSHASGFIGKTGRGTHEHCGVVGQDRHHHHHARQGARRRLRRLRQRARASSSRCAASGRGRTCSPTPSPPVIVVGRAQGAGPRSPATTERRDKLE